MNIKQMKELEDLKERLEEKQRIHATLYQEKVVPLLKTYEDDLYNMLKSYFEENEFNVSESKLSFEARYKNLIYEVESNNKTIVISRDGDKGPLLEVVVTYKSSAGGSKSYTAKNEYEKQRESLKHRIELEDYGIEILNNPKVYYQVRDGSKFDHAKDIVDILFGE